MQLQGIYLGVYGIQRLDFFLIFPDFTDISRVESWFIMRKSNPRVYIVSNSIRNIHMLNHDDTGKYKRKCIYCETATALTTLLPPGSRNGT